MQVKNRIKEIRLLKGYTQEQVCRYLEIPSTTYRNIEYNKFKKIDVVLMFKMKKFFEVDSIEDLFYLDE